jgi:hypothetical protein
MCGGNAGRQQHHANEEAKRRQAQADADARRRREEMERVARERQAAAAQQQAQLVAMQREQAAQQAAQDQQVAGMRAEQAERIGGIRARGQAVSSSLTILAQQGREQGPTAAVDTTRRNARGAKTTQASLRMGAGSYGAGSGANISV